MPSLSPTLSVLAGLCVAAATAPVAAACPYLDGTQSAAKTSSGLPSHHPPLWRAPDPSEAARRWLTQSQSEDHAGYASAAAALDWSAVKADVISLMHSSDPRWPSDYGNYGPLLVRLAWHTSGSYRQSDGRGGVSGGVKGSTLRRGQTTRT